MRQTRTPSDAAIPIKGNLSLTGRFPRLLVWVKGGSDNRRDWKRLIKRLTLAYESCDENGTPLPAQDFGHKTAFVVYGLPQCLRQLLDGADCLFGIPTFVMDAKPPSQASGAGTVKNRGRGTGGEVDTEPLQPWTDGPIR